MKDADKTLIDSVLSVFRFAVSNKTAPKVRKNAPIFGRGRVKIKLLCSRHLDVMSAKVDILFETTKKPHDGGSRLGRCGD